jgi:DNA polymerase-3 subunit delta'
VPLHPLIGHEDLQARLIAAMNAGTLPPALLLAGPRGVGKQRIGLWLAQALVCEKGPGAPCGECQACRMALNLAHPDVHWFFPVARPRGDESKQVEEVEETLAAQIATRREHPVYQPPDGMAGLFLPLVRSLHRRAQMRPAMAKRKAFVLGEADRLVPQDSSHMAANAMLKILEEPPPDTWFILTTTEPAALLPTIRSRMVQLRVGRLKAADIVRFLTEVAKPPVAAAEARRRADMAAGSIGAALEHSGSEAESLRALAKRLLAAAANAGTRHAYTMSIKPAEARGKFTDLLDAAADMVRDDLASRLKSGSSDGATALAASLKAIEKARKLAQGNVNPQLITSELLRQLAGTRSA